MKINGIAGSNLYFGNMYVNDKARKMIDAQPLKDREEIQEMEKELKNSKYWDLKLETIESGDMYNFYYTLVNKKDPTNVHILGIHPYKAEGNKVKVRSAIDWNTDRIEELTFPNEEKVQELFAIQDDIVSHSKEERLHGLRPVKKLRRGVQQLKLLDEAYEYMDKKGLIKPEPTYIDASPKGPNANYYLEYIYDQFRKKNQQ